ncbi:hypothetical protein QBL02_00390 [Leucobacter sp. UT-8R-CII-1-4]|uniref:homoserine dehydrogenase n=1 Tax=Leucobacter sp. UT-8R-CII-1-4 TaxID=3040075 RepID=UPI0024A98EF1|nr:hypothetical protein [Leucobacter sp. UT-8R-CII-1-4]MDI6021996.1 hypothetical protein [Leucobacter sp. UT-8R-CII-1-4]
MTREIRVAIAGAGGVGRALANTLLRRRAEYRDRLGIDVLIAGFCSSSAGLADPRGIAQDALFDRAVWRQGLTGAAWLDEVQADVLFEAGPSDYVSGQPGLGYFEGALDRKMHCIAIAKGALVCAGDRLTARAAEQGVRVFASAAGAAALPVIDFVSHDLAGAGVERVEAVLTGTAAFVLDEMWRNNQNLEDALAVARELGIAEADPTFDLDGFDTAAKLVIIAGFAFGEWLSLADVPRQSVREITEAQMQAWRSSAEKPALVGVIERSDNSLSARVSLQAYKKDHPYSRTSGSTKGVFVVTRDLGEYSILGGASSPAATVAAALKDFEHLVREIQR